MIVEVLLVLAALNIAVAAAYGYDKHKARADKWRTPEKTLIFQGLFAPVGAIIGMHLFRHKTRKLKFLLIYVFLILHIAAIYWLYSTGRL